MLDLGIHFEAYAASPWGTVMNAASESLVDRRQHVDATSSNVCLEIQELSLRFGATQVLDNVALRVHEGETVAILGE